MNWSIPQLQNLFRRLKGVAAWRGSRGYWTERYAQGGTSGSGSYGRLALHKAAVVNRVIERLGAESIAELGCGDGNQAAMFRVRRYVGIDVSPEALRMAQRRVPDGEFYLLGAQPEGLATDIALSLDVLYHLTERRVFEQHLRLLFEIATKAVVIYSTDHDEPRRAPHVRSRNFTKWVDAEIQGWRLVERLPPPWPARPGDPEGSSDALFVIYEPVGGDGS